VLATREHAILALELEARSVGVEDLIRERIMGRAMLAVFVSGLVTAACASPPVAAQVGEPILIRDGFVVPPGKRLLVDDMSVECVIASEVFDEQEFHKVGVEMTALLRIEYPPDACPEAVDSLGGGGECPSQDYVVGTGAAHGIRALFIQPGQPDRHVLRVGAGREMNVFAGAGATLTGVCQGVGVNIISRFISAGSGRLVDVP
jgi:hypothetical protein